MLVFHMPPNFFGDFKRKVCYGLCLFVSKLDLESDLCVLSNTMTHTLILSNTHFGEKKGFV